MNQWIIKDPLIFYESNIILISEKELAPSKNKLLKLTTDQYHVFNFNKDYTEPVIYPAIC